MTHYRQTGKATLLATAWLLGMASACLAQQPFQYKYTLADGLPSVEAEFIRFSKKGELWTTYSAGEHLSRFDGVQWTHYRLDSLGLPTKLTILNEDLHGIWFAALTKEATTMVRFTPDEKWKTYKVEGYCTPYFDPQDKRVKLLGGRRAYSYAYDPVKDIFARSETSLLPDAEINSYDKYHSISSYGDNNRYLMKNLSSQDSFVCYFGKNFEQSFLLDKSILHIIDPREKRFLIRVNSRFYWEENGSRRVFEPVLPDGSVGQILLWQPLFKWENGPLPDSRNGFQVKHPTLDLLYLYELHDDGSLELLLSHLDKDVQKFFAQDPLGHWWYTTSTGIVRTDQSQLVFDQSAPEMVSGLHSINQDAEGNIWFGGYNGQGGFSVFDGKQLRRRIFSEVNLRVMPGAHLGKSGNLYFFTEGSMGLVAIKDERMITHLLPNTHTGFYICPLSNEKIGMGLFGIGMCIAEEENGIISKVKWVGKDKGLLLDNVLTIAEDKAGRLWAGRTSQGVAVYDPARDTAVTWLRSPDVPQSVGALASCVDENGTLWLGTNDGVYQLPDAHLFDYLHTDLFSRLQKLPLPGLASQHIHALLNTDQFLVAGTPDGLYFLDKKYAGDRPRIFSMLFEKDISGQGTEQNTLHYFPTLDGARFLWVGTQRGATRIDLSLLRFDTSATTLSLNTFTAGGAHIPFSEGKISPIPAKKRSITFSFHPSGNTFLKDDLYFDITVINSRGDTLFNRIQTKERTGEMPYLPQGDYTLHVTAYKHNIVSGQAVWEFTIPRLPSENPWVLAGMALVVLGIPFTYLYLKKRHQVELEKSRRERDGLQIRALANFFNPHFINNTLHWVQSRYRKDPDTATIIGRLSENVEHLFNNTQSGKAYHPLSVELDILQNYLKIQQLRFGESLRVSLDLPKDMGNLSVPAMLLQIYCENAVEKGIRNRKGAGHFFLSVKIDRDGCRILMEDDGRGRPLTEAALTSKRKGSTVVMADLISLFNRYNRRPLTVRYEDHIFSDTDGERYGTRVYFFIPDNYNYELS